MLTTRGLLFTPVTLSSSSSNVHLYKMKIMYLKALTIKNFIFSLLTWFHINWFIYLLFFSLHLMGGNIGYMETVRVKRIHHSKDGPQPLLVDLPSTYPKTSYSICPLFTNRAWMNCTMVPCLLSTAYRDASYLSLCFILLKVNDNVYFQFKNCLKYDLFFLHPPWRQRRQLKGGEGEKPATCWS